MGTNGLQQGGMFGRIEEFQPLWKMVHELALQKMSAQSLNICRILIAARVLHEQVHVVADPHLELTKALGVELEAAPMLGTNRCKRLGAGPCLAL